jgi:hypothetical protein
MSPEDSNPLLATGWSLFKEEGISRPCRPTRLDPRASCANAEDWSLAALLDRLYPCCRSLLVRIVREIGAVFFDVAGVTSAYE